MKKIMLVLCISLLFGLLAWFPLVHAQGSAPTVVPPVPADVLPAPVEQRPLLIAADSGPAWEFLDAAVPPAGASAGTGVISGTITGAATGQPLAARSIDFNLEGDGSLTTAVLAHLRTESDPDPVRTLHYNLGFNPASLDPAVAIDTISLAVIEQLFLGLVDLDDDTGEVRPELASSWDVSDDGTVYTFTLRSDATWTDGRAVTAHDARYGILRSLNPATGATYASSLFLIRNAQAYNTGVITDTSQVGVTALDDTHLRIELEHAAAYVLSLLSLSTARPLPRLAM